MYGVAKICRAAAFYSVQGDNGAQGLRSSMQAKRHVFIQILRHLMQPLVLRP